MVFQSRSIQIISMLLFLLSSLCQAEGESLLLGGSELSDEFNTEVNLLSDNMSGWSVLGSGMSNERATSIEVIGGRLRVVPQQFSMNGWFEDEYGPLVFKTVSGNFSVMTSLRVVNNDHPELPPNVGFNAGGFVIRDPVGTHTNDENWVMYNMGGQGVDGVTYSREVKKTVNSISNLFLTEQVGMEEYLLVCRVGSDFYFYHWADDVHNWREEHYYNQFDVDGVTTTTWHNSSSVTPEIIPPLVGQSVEMSFNHTIMPNTVQVGVMGHTWSSDSVQASFDFVRFAAHPPLSKADCLTEFDPFDLIYKSDFEN
jgi:hypothetical protein